MVERVVAERLSRHLDLYGLRDDFQSAYRPGHSTELALLRIKNYIDLALDQGKGVPLVFWDLSAAFDTIGHQILLDRLECACGVTGRVHQWLSSYLSNRTHRAKIGESLSKPKTLHMGVPQGSVLGPPLFSIYYQPVIDIIKKRGCCYHGYADDMQLYT